MALQPATDVPRPGTRQVRGRRTERVRKGPAHPGGEHERRIPGFMTQWYWLIMVNTRKFRNHGYIIMTIVIHG